MYNVEYIPQCWVVRHQYWDSCCGLSLPSNFQSLFSLHMGHFPDVSLRKLDVVAPECHLGDEFKASFTEAVIGKTYSA